MCSGLNGASELRFVSTLKTRTSVTQYFSIKLHSGIRCIADASLNAVTDFTESNFSAEMGTVDKFQESKRELRE